MSTSSKQSPVVKLPPKILGLSGTFGGGKDTVAAWLNQHHGYFHISTGDMVREVAQARFGDTDRPILHQTANSLRRERGSGVLVELALEHYSTLKQQYPGGIVISGIRSIGEAKAIHNNGGWLLFVDAPLEVRYKRIHSRARGDESVISYEDALKRDEEEVNPSDQTDETIQNLGKIEQMSDAIIYNIHERSQFLEDIRVLLELPKR